MNLYEAYYHIDGTFRCLYYTGKFDPLGPEVKYYLGTIEACNYAQAIEYFQKEFSKE